MFICVSTLGYCTCGQPLVMRADEELDQIGVYEIGGRFVGYVSLNQPEGCLKKEFILSKMGINRVLCSGAVAMGGKLIVTTDSPLLKNSMISRIEREGYGIPFRL